MSATAAQWMEASFNISYLIVVWGLVVAMIRQREAPPGGSRRLGAVVTWAFGLLALGDTGHVGLRVLAYGLGGLDKNLPIFGFEIPLVGAGAFATAFTVTLFYVLMLEAWRVRFNRHYATFEYLLLAAAAARLLIMLAPANEWSRSTPPQPWSTIRNLPLMLQGLGLAALILRDAAQQRDPAFRWIGVMILISYACYLPVILFVQQMPMLGMLMIPKTLAYLGAGFIAYSELYLRPALRPAAGLN
jgi:hypothetical protein